MLQDVGLVHADGVPVEDATLDALFSRNPQPYRPVLVVKAVSLSRFQPGYPTGSGGSTRSGAGIGSSARTVHSADSADRGVILCPIVTRTGADSRTGPE